MIKYFIYIFIIFILLDIGNNIRKYKDELIMINMNFKQAVPYDPIQEEWMEDLGDGNLNEFP